MHGRNRDADVEDAHVAVGKGKRGGHLERGVLIYAHPMCETESWWEAVV